MLDIASDEDEDEFEKKNVKKAATKKKKIVESEDDYSLDDWVLLFNLIFNVWSVNIFLLFKE